MNSNSSFLVLALSLAAMIAGCSKATEPADQQVRRAALEAPNNHAPAAPGSTAAQAVEALAAPKPGPTEAAAPAAKAPDPTAEHAAGGVKPGTHEDWCGEHHVAESQCTRCNPKLVAAFKATGDWCKEHGLPESQCKVCNPSLKIERPAKAEAGQ